MGFDKRENAKPYALQEGDTLRTIAERETAAGNPLTWQELARFNWGTDDEAEVNAFLRDELGARRRDADNNFVLAADDEPRGQLLIPAPFARRGLALEKTYTLRVRKKTAPAQFLECCHVPGITFGFNSSFVRPSVVEYLKKLERVAERHPDAKIMIFGHTDAVGDDLYNKKLSERRAWSVHAFVTNDTDAWEVLYNHPDEAWGLAVVQEILADLGHDPGAIDGDLGAQTRTAMRSLLGLPEQAPVQNDAAFRKQLFAAYMASKHDIDLPPERFMDPAYMGCGEFNQVTGDEKEAEQNRRVTFFFFHPERVPTLPCAFADTGPCSKQIVTIQYRHNERYRCSFFDSLSRECRGKTHPPTARPTIHFVEVAPALQGAADVDDVNTWGGASFSPPLGHHVHFRAEVRDLPQGFSGTARLEIVRLTNEASKPFVVVAELDQSVIGDGIRQVLFTWDGVADRDVEAHLSDRTTPRVDGTSLHIPVREISSGSRVPHGIYHVRRVMLVDGSGTQLDESQVQNVSVSVPVLVVLRFNSEWRADVISFGLEHFREQVELGIRAYCQSVYTTAGAHARFLFDTSRTARTAPAPTDLTANVPATVDVGGHQVTPAFDEAFVIDIGGVQSPIPTDDEGNKKLLLGRTRGPPNNIFVPAGVRHIDHTVDNFNMFVTLDGARVCRIYVSHLINYNDWSSWGIGTTKFRTTFYGLGVRRSTSVLWTDSGLIRTRWKAGPDLNPNRTLTSDEAGSFAVVLSSSGMATVSLAQPGSRRAAKRAKQVERALRRFVRMVGNVVAHEVGHAFGLVTPQRREDGTPNVVSLSDGTRVGAPLAGDATGHARFSDEDDIMVIPGGVPFAQFVQTAKFGQSNAQYLKDCLPRA